MEEYLKTLGQISGELWKNFKNFMQDAKPESDDFWQKVIEAKTEIVSKYMGTPYERYARDYALALDIEMESKLTGRQFKPRERKSAE